jgi:hypothetical protein
MSKTLLETYRMMKEASVLPKNLGPGSGQAGQHTVGNQTVRSKTPEQFNSDYKNNTAARVAAPSVAVDRVKRGVGPDDKPVPRVAPPNAGAGSGATAPVARPVRPGEKVPGEKVGTNAQLTAQAIARKGFGKAAGGGNYKSAVPLPRNPANFPGDKNGTEKPKPPTNWPGGRNEPGTVADKINKAGSVAPTGGPDKAKAEPAKTEPAMTRSQKIGKAMRDHIAKGGKHGDTIDVDGAKIKVAWKDKAYQKRLTNKSAKPLEERVIKMTRPLADLPKRNKRGQQSTRKRYRGSLTEALKKHIKKRKAELNFEPETSTSWN